MLREALAQQFEGIRYTSARTEDATAETENWLRENQTAICGAVVTFSDIRARIPILLKENNELTIIQVHGKHVKKNHSTLFDNVPLGRPLHRYLLMAAYRRFVLQQVMPEAEIRCLFMFPQKSFKAETERLYQKTQGVREIKPHALRELKKLFATVDGTHAAGRVMKNISGEFSHSTFSGLPVSGAVKKMQSIPDGGEKVYVESVHEACKNCDFRRSFNGNQPGCWDMYFSDSEVINSDRHQFDLIGHHVESEAVHLQMYQEKYSLTENLSTPEKVIHHTGKKIAIYHRKAMQLLDAKNQKLPLVFAKENIRKIKEIEYPVHFLDFEAAAHAVPFEKGKRPYDPVLFQFSCHTLFKNGELKHTQWLDQGINSQVHPELISKLSQIPEFYKGTIIQYSGFERQALNRLYRETRRIMPEGSSELKILEQLLQVKKRRPAQRFLDLSLILRDGYYNRFMNNGLSLKQVLHAIITAESKLRTWDKTEYDVMDKMIDLFRKDGQGIIINPYHQLSDERSRIQDGITAMHAYLCLKAGTLSEKQKILVPVLLRRYCSMDTLALYLIFIHLLNITKTGNSLGDLVIEG